jgi:hypothetical protein
MDEECIDKNDFEQQEGEITPPLYFLSSFHTVALFSSTFYIQTNHFIQITTQGSSKFVSAKD